MTPKPVARPGTHPSAQTLGRTRSSGVVGRYLRPRTFGVTGVSRRARGASLGQVLESHRWTRVLKADQGSGTKVRHSQPLRERVNVDVSAFVAGHCDPSSGIMQRRKSKLMSRRRPCSGLNERDGFHGIPLPTAVAKTSMPRPHPAQAHSSCTKCTRRHGPHPFADLRGCRRPPNGTTVHPFFSALTVRHRTQGRRSDCFCLGAPRQ
jgi:hypothetical protein